VTNIHDNDRQLSSPFAFEAHSEKSHPVVRDDDKRLTRVLPQGMVVKQWKPGESGNPAGRPPASNLKKGLEDMLLENHAKTGKTIERTLNERLVNTALGKLRPTPTQMRAMELIRYEINGKPKTQEDSTQQVPALIFDIDFNL
jgi:hypothetical protein